MPGNPRRFALLLVKPSHYDDDGYVIQWFRSAIPSNSLAALFGLAQDCAVRRVLGDDVEIDFRGAPFDRVAPGAKQLVRPRVADRQRLRADQIGRQLGQLLVGL